MRKKMATIFLAMVLAVTTIVPLEMLNNKQNKVIASEVSLSNPQIGTQTEGTQDTTTWDCIWFGNYPKSEVTSEDSIYTILQNSDEWENGELTVDGVQYRRINGYDATICRGRFEGGSVEADRKGTYQWTSKEEYHYFRYEPIKWRVLQVEDNKAFLLADELVDCKLYGMLVGEQVWENSALRSWLNGYSGETNLENKDCTEDNFIQRAFNQSEQNAIFTTHVLNEDNIEYGTEAGNDTDDKIFLLSEREAMNEDYGFDSRDNWNDSARIARAETVTTYARVMGAIWGVTKEDNVLYYSAGLWFLRSPSNGPGRVRIVYDQGYLKKDGIPNVAGVGIRPAIYLDISDTSLYSYAGTVDSNGNSQEEEAPQIPGKQDLTVAELPKVSEITYGQSLADSSLTGGRVVNSAGEKIEGSWRFIDTSFTPNVSDSGKTGYEVQFLPKDFKVYNRLTEKVTIEIAKKTDPPVTIPAGTNLSVGYAKDQKIGDIDLSDYYSGWSWSEDSKDTSLVVGETVSVQAVYQDTENYENTTAAFTVTMAACTHQYSAFTSDGNATCERDGTMTTVCTICGDRHTVAESGSRKRHNYQITEEREATCTTDGKVVTTCTNCGKSTTQTSKAYGHSYEITQNTLPTCTQKGFYEMQCSRCEDVQHTDLPAIGHNYELEKYTQPTCTSSGTKYYRCKHAECPEPSYTEQVPELGHDYSEPYVTKCPTCTEEGVRTRTCLQCGSIKEEQLDKKDHTVHSYTEPAEMDKDGSIVKRCTTCGEVIKTSKIHALSSVKISGTTYEYNGKTRQPSVTVKDSENKMLKERTDYTVSYSKGRKNVGEYTVTITFKGNYSGTIKKTFNIIPKSTSISKVSAAKKGFSLKWKKQTSQVTGYQIQYSTSSKFTKKTTKAVTISKNKTTSESISKLKAKKKYYVRIRTYKMVKVNGKNTKSYSSWSKTKTVTTKK